MATKQERSEAAAVLGRAGGKARAKALTDKQREAIARKGAAKRWGTRTKKKRAKVLDAKQESADDVSRGAREKAPAESRVAKHATQSVGPQSR